MSSFRGIKELTEIESDQWTLFGAFPEMGKIVGPSGKSVDPVYKGRKYSVFAKSERPYSFLERAVRLSLAVLFFPVYVVIYGQTAPKKIFQDIRPLITRKTEVVFYGILLKDDLQSHLVRQRTSKHDPICEN